MKPKNVQQLMQVHPRQHDLQWLKDALQEAIKVEFSTIPPYLCAMWSIIDENDNDVRRSLKDIIFEEMLHFGIVCNILTTIGGTPQIIDPDNIPKYPDNLPGHIHPGLKVGLTGLSKSALKVFMHIELPESPITRHLGYKHYTIGAFYDAILKAFSKQNSSVITKQNQISLQGLPPYKDEMKMNSMDDIKNGILTIKRQGEGTGDSPEDSEPNKVTGVLDLAHYYRFAEIYHGKKLVKQSNGVWGFTGDVIPFPASLPVAKVPKKGYPELLETQAFRKTYKLMLEKLQHAWETGTQNSLDSLDDGAVGAMFSMGAEAFVLMNMSRPNGGNYAPDFQLPEN